ncbi:MULTISPECIES: McrC family protein [unclassified Streptomyces]|uniref:McrC family protein n=1 Tax=unclassified Streptomyces TaxID=2593676 RepID=UPI00278BD0D2|nr:MULTISPECIES: restriction endonuclease [unclassified Streptomyces]
MSDDTVVELVEHARPVRRALPDAVGRTLAASRIVEATPDPYVPGWWTLKANSKVGAVRLEVDGEAVYTLRITPKVAIGRLFFLLGYSLDPRGWRDSEVDVAEHRELLPALAYAFERQVEQAVGRGLLQGYRPTEESSLVVRGRIREAEQIRRRFGAALPVEIAYDEFTTDIAENRLLRAAVERLLRIPDVPRDVRSRLLHQRARLADVTPLVRGQEPPRWQATRLNSRYRHALHLARAILEGASAEHRTGELRINGFLFDMNKLFEDFVCVALREALLPYGGHSSLQAKGIHFDEDAAIRMKPDFVWYGDGGQPLLVADAKYKAGKPDGYPNADLYQMLAYCSALGLGAGHLVYAQGNAPHNRHQVRQAGTVLHQHALDLNQEPARLLAEVSMLVQAMVHEKVPTEISLDRHSARCECPRGDLNPHAR